MRERVRRTGVLAAALALAWGGPARGQDGGAAATCRDRLEALALMQTLNARILGSRSATASLEAWCGARRLAPEPKVTARLIPGAAKAPTADQLRRLQVASADELRYRRVQLVCGGHVLSEADNWYVPGRLTPEMNRLLETTDTPFGRAVQALEPYRQTFSARLLWEPLPEGWEGRPTGGVCEGAEGALGRPGLPLRAPGRALHRRPTAVLRSGRALHAGDSGAAGEVIAGGPKCLGSRRALRKRGADLA